MKMKKIAALMAVATVLNSGVGAYAVGFTPDSNGNQSAWEHADHTANGGTDMPSVIEGEIEVNGTFKKTISNLPNPDKDGRYLRVTMPIKIDYTYDVDSNIMTSAIGSVLNESVHVTGTGNKQVLEEQPIKMQIMRLEDGANGTMTPDAKFVNVVDVNSKDSVQLPFKLSVTKKGGVVKEYNLADIYNKEANAIDVAAGEKLQLEFKLIDGQTIGNGNLIDQATSLTNHKLKMKFEYKGK